MNRLPTLSELPPAPSDKTGWPWTEEAGQVIESTPTDGSWPCISIVTPSYNQGEFIEETIRSVLLQGYPNLEYIIIDGGSVDGSVDIIRKYAPWLSYWISEPDRCQSHAINKGFKRANGEIIAWLNSDDFYVSGAIHRLIEIFKTCNTVICYGNCNMVNHQSELIQIYKSGPMRFENIMSYWVQNALPAQPSVFFKRSLYLQVGPLDEKLNYVMDYDLWLRMLVRHNPIYIDQPLSNYRIHQESKTGKGWGPFFLEHKHVSMQYWRAKGLRFGLKWWLDHARFILRLYVIDYWKWFRGS